MNGLVYGSIKAIPEFLAKKIDPKRLVNQPCNVHADSIPGDLWVTTWDLRGQANPPTYSFRVKRGELNTYVVLPEGTTI